jgi:diaminopropionate ammonia-lyase
MHKNSYRHQKNHVMCEGAPFPSIDVDAPRRLLARCPDHAETPLHSKTFDGIDARFFIKDERARMGLGSFKALGAAYVIADMAEQGGLKDQTFVTASAGNHGLSVAVGAKIFGAKAVIYLSHTVPENFADRLRGHGAEVCREGDDYEASLSAALNAADDNGWALLSDTSWPGYTEIPHRLMEGYLVLAAETAEQITAPPTHIFLQAGVGGLAGACAAYFRSVWGDAPQIFVVEPEAAPALHDAVAAGRVVNTKGPVSSMGRLDCKEASLIGLNGLGRDADGFILVSDIEVEEVMPLLAKESLATTPSGGAGLVAALTGKVALPRDARVLAIISEEA